MDEDNLPLRILPRLRQRFPYIAFRELDPSENMPEDEYLVIIDSAEGIEKTVVLMDIDKISSGKLYSLHDFDLGFTLKLMKKAGKLKEIKLICVPRHLDEDTALKEISAEIERISNNKN